MRKAFIMLSSKQKLQIAGAFLVLLFFATVLGCNGFFVNPTLTSIAVGPTATIQQNGTVQMSAVGTYNDGTTQSLSHVFWSSADTSVATISNSGLVTGVSPGSSTITGASGTVSGTATVTVALSNVTGITINPTSATAAQNGGFQNFTASATISGGSPVDITATATWSISSVSTGNVTDFTVTQGQNPEVVTVGSSATIGERATVTATYTSGANTFTANATLTVIQ
ncbi:MAG TPA: Ig-like domain-containing protein [Terriglobales bacterium]|nr:Ig-like domain-containing protein [Terriglobales bacterium]